MLRTLPPKPLRPSRLNCLPPTAYRLLSRSLPRRDRGTRLLPRDSSSTCPTFDGNRRPPWTARWLIEASPSGVRPATKEQTRMAGGRIILAGGSGFLGRSLAGDFSRRGGG